jgi:drug/metabolite transporter (DMT)-like permease
MKLGMYQASGAPALTAIQVASIRILSASLVLLPFSIRAFKQIPSGVYPQVLLAGLIGSFFPAYLFCIAETRIDSALTAMLNSSTPIFAVICSAVVFRKAIPANQVLGVIIGFAGCIFLFYNERSQSNQHFLYAGYVVLATVCYGLNVNFVKQKLSHINSRDLASLSFAFLLIPSAVILIWAGYFKQPLGEPAFIKASLASALLGVMGTAIATIIFYAMVKIGSAVFASLVTYGIPFVAIGWGILYGETIGILQLLALLVILGGVYIASRPAIGFSWMGKRK